MAKAQYIGVSGVARKVKQPYIGVSGVARKVKNGYIGVSGVARQFFAGIDPVFSNNTWSDIIAACQSGNVPDEWSVGDSKIMTINGTDRQIDIIGKNHDTYYSGGATVPLTFQTHDSVTTTMMNSSNTDNGGWDSCRMRNTTLQTYLNYLPSEVSGAIREVSKVSGNGYNSTITSADRLFLLSESEVYDTAYHSVRGEGTQYEYYKAVNNRIKYYNGSQMEWWLRSACTNSDTNFNYAYSQYNTGDWQAGATTELGVAFAFCF